LSELLSPKQVAKLLQMSERWVRQQASQGHMPCVRLGKMLRFRPDDLQEYIRRNHRAGERAA
jgi:excisionase family DNA binding protein